MKKFLVLILSLICAFAVAFTACADNGGNQPEVPNNEQPSGNQEEENQGTPNKDPENPDDGEGDGEDPENPDDGEGDGEDPENPDGGEGDGEDPENPDDGEGDGEDPDDCTYSPYWSCDENYHWHVSTCPEHPDKISSYAPHNYVGGRCVDCQVSSSSVYRVGDRMPDYTVDTFISSYKENSFSFADARGKVLVINFWYISCGPCVEEMPELEATKQQFGDDVIMLALHADDNEVSAAQAFIDIAQANQANPNMPKVSWSNYKTIFGKDSGNSLFRKCGGTTLYPLTVVVDAEGIITYITTGTVLEFNWNTGKYTNTLTPQVQAALNKRKN